MAKLAPVGPVPSRRVQRVVDALGGGLDPWGYVLVFLLTALEASAFVGLFVPGEAALLFAGFLVYENRLDMAPAIAVAVVGGVIGDSIGYEIGRHLGSRLHDGWLGEKVGEHRWDRARAYVRNHGGRAVLVGRFVGVLRALVPAIAGDARMRYRTFLAWNALGAVVWAPALVIGGYLAGSSYHTVERYLGRATLVVSAVVVVVVLAVHLLRRRRTQTRRI